MPQVGTSERSKAPVFVVGSARSGTTLLYHLLLSSGHFASYRGEPAVFDLLLPKFGSFRKYRTRQRLARLWLRSAMFRISGLDPNLIANEIVNHCSNPGDFLRITMGAVARLQGLDRWAVWGPDNLLYIKAIKNAIPEALFLHLIRDGRDVAVSMRREGWIRPFPWDRRLGLVIAGLHWRWKVTAGRRNAQVAKTDYMEVRFEELLANPQNVVGRVGEFINQPLDYEFMCQHAIGTLINPNSTFEDECKNNAFRPVGRWERVLSNSEALTLEAAIGDTLAAFGYALKSSSRLPLRIQMTRWIYPRYFEAKQWLKMRTFLGRFVRVDRLHLGD